MTSSKRERSPIVGKRSRTLLSMACASATWLAAGCLAAGAQTPATAPEPSAAVAPTAPAASPSPSQGVVSPAQPDAAQSAAVAAGAETPPAEIVPDSCFASPSKLDPSKIDEFLATPEGLLTRHEVGGMALSNEVRALAGSDKRTIEPLIRLSAAAKPEQKAMIGAGLGRAAFACSRIAPAYAALIQSLMASSNSPELLTAFLSATNDVQTAALGAAGGGGGAAAAGLSGGGISGPGSAGLGGDAVVPTTVETYTFPFSRGGGLTIRSDNSTSPSNND